MQLLNKFNTVVSITSFNSKEIVFIKSFVLLKTKIGSELFDKFSNTVQDIFDKSIVSSNNWLLYGCKKPNNQPYLLTKHLNYDNKELSINSFAVFAFLIASAAGPDNVSKSFLSFSSKSFVLVFLFKQ